MNVMKHITGWYHHPLPYLAPDPQPTISSLEDRIRVLEAENMRLVHAIKRLRQRDLIHQRILSAYAKRDWEMKKKSP